MADGLQAVEWIRTNRADAVVDSGEYGDQHWVELKADSLVETARVLRDDPVLAYEMLLDVTAVHWPDRPLAMELVYHLYSFERNDRLRLKVCCADKGSVPTLTGLWRSADWNERETFDMFGVRFDGHPDLRRILMPDDYTDFPLRKEFPLYRG